jgi:predicted nucleotidyltransferase
MHQLIQQHLSAIVDLCRRYHVRRLEVFGSAARAEDFDEKRSDVDFLVEFDPPALEGFARSYFDFQEALQDLVGRKVDLVSRSAIRNPYFLAGVEKTRELLYEA